jgi:hypothetical protein
MGRCLFASVSVWGELELHKQANEQPQHVWNKIRAPTDLPRCAGHARRQGREFSKCGRPHVLLRRVVGKQAHKLLRQGGTQLVLSEVK